MGKKILSLCIALCLVLLCACTENSIDPKPEPPQNEEWAFDSDSESWTAARPSSLPILMYHNITENKEEAGGVSVSAEKFEKDMEYLFNNGYTPILPRELISLKTFPKKPVIISFDDGYRSNYELAFPILKAHKAKAQISVIVYNIDAEYPTFMSWDMAREMEESGLVEIGSHTNNEHNPDTGGAGHENDTNGLKRRKGESVEAHKARVENDLKTSKERLKAELGKDTVSFAYPFGEYDAESQAIVSGLFEVSFSTSEGKASLKKGLHSLQRLAVKEDTDLSKILK